MSYLNEVGVVKHTSECNQPVERKCADCLMQAVCIVMVMRDEKVTKAEANLDAEIMAVGVSA